MHYTCDLGMLLVITWCETPPAKWCPGSMPLPCHHTLPQSAILVSSNQAVFKCYISLIGAIGAEILILHVLMNYSGEFSHCYYTRIVISFPQLTFTVHQSPPTTVNVLPLHLAEQWHMYVESEQNTYAGNAERAFTMAAGSVKCRHSKNCMQSLKDWNFAAAYPNRGLVVSQWPVHTPAMSHWGR